VPRTLAGYVVARAYTAAARLVCDVRGDRITVQVDDDPSRQDEWLGGRLSNRQVWWEKRFERKLLSSADAVWVVSTSLAEHVAEAYGVDPGRIRVVPNGGSVPPERGEADGVFRFVYAGALHRDRYDVGALVDAFARTSIPDARLVLAGYGGEWIPPYLDQLGDRRIEYRGPMDAKQAQSVVRDCDVGVVTCSPGGYLHRTLPGKVGEYLACGLPILSTVRGDTLRLIEEHGVGSYCEERDLAWVMEAIARRDGAFLKMRDNARRLSSAYTWPTIFRRAMRGSPQARGLPPSRRERAQGVPRPAPEGRAAPRGSAFVPGGLTSTRTNVYGSATIRTGGEQ
jgi:glycosyltransferase involved in cell wall biosynthesis